MFLCTYFNTTIANEKILYTIVFRNIKKPNEYHGVNAFTNISENQKTGTNIKKRKDFYYVWIWYND